jgi:hypothetical protein
MALLLADLRAFANGLRRRDGHGGLFARLLPPLLLGTMYWLLGSMMLGHPELLIALQSRGDSQTILMAAALSPCPIVAGWIAFAHMHRQLFEAPELGIWLTAPHWRGRAALQLFIRASCTALLWACALAAPFVMQLLFASRAQPFAYSLAPLGIAIAVVPSLAITLGIQIALMRCAAGRSARVALSLLSAMASFGFPVFLLTEVFTGAPARAMALIDSSRVDTGPSPLVAAATQMLASAAKGLVDLAALKSGLVLLVGSCALFLLIARLHPIAVQNHLLAYRPRRLHGGRWPLQPAAAIRHKEFAQTLQQPGALWQMLIVAVMTGLLASQNLVVHDILAGSILPQWLRQCAAMAILWSIAITMLLYTHMGRLSIWDGQQWPLYLQSPISAGTLLRGKLQTIALLLIWPIVVPAFAGFFWFSANPTTVLIFCGFAIAGTMAALAAIISIGTWPWLIRQETDGRITQGSRGFIGSLALMIVFHLAIAPGYLAYHVLGTTTASQRPDCEKLLPYALIGALLIGLLQFALSTKIALGNYRRLLAPR